MAKEPKARFVTLGKSKFVHVVHTELWDRKNSQCQQVRKFTVAGKVPGGSLSPEAALALDDCPRCNTHDRATLLLEKSKTVEQRRAEAQDRRNQTLDKVSGKKVTKPKQHVKATKVKAAKPAKPAKDKPAPKPKQPTRTKAGFRSTGDGYADKTQGKAMEVVAFAEDNGWRAKAVEDNGWMVEAKRNDQTIHVWFVDGKYDLSREAEIVVGTWHGKLRGAHAARRQMDASLDNKDRPFPRPGEARVSKREGKVSKQTNNKAAGDDKESPLDAATMRPFSLDDPDIEIIDAIKGKMIRWRNGVSGTLEEAWVPSKAQGKKRPLISIKQHIKTGKRYVSFLSVQSVNEDGENYGAERNVNLDKIVRVM